MPLPNDICRCINDECELRENCQRWIERDPKDWNTPVGLFFPAWGVCEFQIEKEGHGHE
jgi:hypothetical protein